VYVEAAMPGDVLKVETLSAIPPRAVRRGVEPARQGRAGPQRRRWRPRLSAADFTGSQVVDRTVGVHGEITKSHFRR
jgi:acetamidase/formamidase